jgi:2-polyprenyl-3-methyl-5-hydroxy-6-metoxy-1,4-benzoquinol methylase
MHTQIKPVTLSASLNPLEAAEDQVIRANKEFYKQIAQKYDDYEACASDAFFQRWVEDDLKVIESKLPKRSDAVRCLDCGGGTGNVTLKMLRRGWDVTVVDVSADMLDILERKISSTGASAKFFNEPIESFFSHSNETFDLISFSSVLHHLHSPLNVVRIAAQRISPQGFFYSVFDPVPASSHLAAACFLSLDTFLAKLLHDRADLFPGLARRMRKLMAPRDTAHNRPVISAGDLAEYHAREGIDDAAIENVLHQAGFQVDRRRYPVGRTAFVRHLNRHLQLILNFKILAQRVSERRNEHKQSEIGNATQSAGSRFGS